MTPAEALAEPAERSEQGDRQPDEPTLLASLEELGGKLVSSELPSPAQVRHWVGAIIYYLEKGHTRPPERPDAGAPLGDPRDAQVAALEERIRQLEQGPPVTSEPSPVAPEPAPETSEPPAAVGDPAAPASSASQPDRGER